MSMRTAVIHPDIRGTDRRRSAERCLEEALNLAGALEDLEVVHRAIVPLRDPHPGTLFGSGKLTELKTAFEEAEVDLVLIDGPVSPVQQRNLEKAWNVKLLDRTGLILEIFGERAATREGVLQVDLAHLTYQKTRIVRSWTHLERQRGGGGFIGGPGETQAEADRRALDERIIKLKRQLEKTVKTRELHRSARAKVPFPVVALVGYTNAGKSTLFNRLTGASVLAKDMLFATLDPTMRAVELPSGRRIILSDTVGFISDLPTELVAAFRATLEEVTSADVILHVRDMSSPEAEAEAKDVADVLAGMGIGEEDERVIEVWNKMDRLGAEAAENLRAIAARRSDTVAVSAVTGEGVDTLDAAIDVALAEPLTEEELLLGHGQGRARAWLYQAGVVTGEQNDDDGLHIRVRWTPKNRARYFKELERQSTV